MSKTLNKNSFQHEFSKKNDFKNIWLRNNDHGICIRVAHEFVYKKSLAADF